MAESPSEMQPASVQDSETKTASKDEIADQSPATKEPDQKGWNAASQQIQYLQSLVDKVLFSN